MLAIMRLSVPDVAYQWKGEQFVALRLPCYCPYNTNLPPSYL